MISVIFSKTLILLLCTVSYGAHIDERADSFSLLSLLRPLSSATELVPFLYVVMQSFVHQECVSLWLRHPGMAGVYPVKS